MSEGLAGELAAVTRLWAQLRVGDRARYLERASQAVIDEFDDLGPALAAAARRPAAEVATLELLPAIDALRWLADSAQRLLGAHRFALPRSLHPLTRASAGHAPVGVVGIAGAREAPFALPLTAIGAALLAGNGAILAPAPGAELAAERVAGVLVRAGLPEGLVRIGPAAALAGCERTLDLAEGPLGPDAMIVLADAKLAHAVEGALWAACVGAGQLAGSLKRIYVARERCEELLEALVRGAEEIELGDPLAPHTQLGPLAGEGAAAALEAAIEEAVALGARAPLRRPAPAARPARRLLRTGGAERRAGAGAPRARARRRSGARRHRGRRLGRGGGARERAGALPGRLDLELRPPPRGADRARADGARGLGQRPRAGAAAAPVGRRRARALRARAADHLGARVGQAALALPLRRDARRAPRAPSRCCTRARDGEREQALREGAPAILRLAGRTLRR